MSAASASESIPSRNKHSRKTPTSAGYDPRSIDVTQEEFARIKEALKQEEFRKLFFDYCEEIQDPENRKIYEKELKQFEAERGVDITFINPEPGFVVKSADGAEKCFVNIAKNANIEPPTNRVSPNPATGERGMTWSIPMAQTAPRQDVDAQGKLCRVYDVIFHPDALHLAQSNVRFRKCLVDTALDGVEREYKVKLDRANLKYPKLQYKGVARPTVIRKLSKNPPPESLEPHPLDHVCPEKPTADAGKPKVIPVKANNRSPKPEHATPKYVIKHRRGVDLAECTDEIDAKLNMTVPHEIIVEIELPMLKSSADCQLDVTEKKLFLLSEKPGAKYRLNVELPYAVRDKDGTAKFDVDRRCLKVTLPVVQPTASRQRSMHDVLVHSVDSGVDCDGRDESSNSNRGSPVEELSDFTTVDGVKPEASSEANEEPNDDNRAVSSFLKSSLPYQFPPKVDCNILDDVMSFVLHVRNVQEDSIEKLQLPRSVHLKFASIGSGFYPTYYAFYMELPDNASVNIASVEAEAWENNLVLNVTLGATGETLKSYRAGVDSSDLREYHVQGKFDIPHQRRSHQHKRAPSPAQPTNASLCSSLDVSVERLDCERKVEIEIKPRDQLAAGDEESLQSTKKLSAGKKQRKRNKKRRSYSESSCDDLKAVAAYEQCEQQQQQNKKTGNAVERGGGGDNIDIGADDESSPDRSADDVFRKSSSSAATTASVRVPSGGVSASKQRSLSECRDSAISTSAGSNLPSSCKGILKRFSRYEPRPSTSDSCSSIDDCMSSYSCSADGGYPNSLVYSQSFSDIPEENVIGSGSLSESCKKTVRFSEVIKKQVFRLDSSILGQKKKNQKRRDLKQRALYRRHSEGDSADYEDNNKPIEPLPPSSPRPSNVIKKSENGKQPNNSNGKEMAKRKYPTTPRPRLESESSSDVDGSKGATTAAMMFEMDM